MYELVPADSDLTQGDLLADCPICSWVLNAVDAADDLQVNRSKQQVIVLTQACDLANRKASRIQVAVVYSVQRVVELGMASPSAIRDHVRLHRVYGLYFLPEWEGRLSESIVDLRDIHTLPLELAKEVARKSDRVRLRTPYREHLAQHFAVTYSRIALPEPYPTK